jgi:hypothetical protein
MKYNKTKKHQGTYKHKGGNPDVYENILSSINNLKNNVKNLGEIIQNIKNDGKDGKDVNKQDNSETNEIPDDILDKIEEKQEEMNNVLENIDTKEEEIIENKNNVNLESNIDKEELEESKEELKNNIEILSEKLNDGLEDNPLVNSKQRDRSFYLKQRTWGQWFYGFVEYYDELSGSLNNIVKNSYYNMILQKAKNKRTTTENNIVEKVNELEIELRDMNKNIIKGGYRKKHTKKYRKLQKLEKTRKN